LAYDLSSTSSVSNVVSGTGGFIQLGSGLLNLTATNTYSGGTSVQNGTLQVSADANLGTGNVTGTSAGTLDFAGTFTTAKSFTMSGGTLKVESTDTETFNGNTVSGAILVGPGTFATTAASTVQFVSVIIGSSGSVTVGAVGVLDVNGFASYGTLNLLPATVGSGQYTLLTNLGATQLYFISGSTTYLGTPSTANSGSPPTPTFVAGIDMHGQNLDIYQGLFVNNGFVVDSLSSTTSVIVDGGGLYHGALYKGAGYTGSSPVTQNGGYVQAGNSPGSNHVGKLTFGIGGVLNYLIQIDDATGVAGPAPDAAGHVDGWSLVNAGDFIWAADSTHKLTVGVQSLINPTTVGTDPIGTMDNFDPRQSYVWTAIHWTGTYTGPTDAATLNAATTFDTSAVANAFGGKFSWQLDMAAKTLSLVYTPPPAVAAVQLNNGGSGVQSMTVTFSTAVSFAGGNAAAAFRLTNVDTGAAVALTATVSTDSLGRTVVTLTFSGDQTNSLDALLSGRYALTIVGSAVTGTNGVALDGSGTGAGNGVDYVGPIWTIG
jgi:autotransporter-associated beta strand protein